MKIGPLPPSPAPVAPDDASDTAPEPRTRQAFENFMQVRDQEFYSNRERTQSRVRSAHHLYRAAPFTASMILKPGGKLPTDTQYLLAEASREVRLAEAADLGDELERNEQRLADVNLSSQEKKSTEIRNMTIEHLLRECYDLCGNEPTFRIFSREIKQEWPTGPRWYRHMPMPTMEASHQNNQASHYSAATTSLDAATAFAKAWGERGSIFVVAPAPHGIFINGLKESQGILANRFGHELEVCYPGPTPVEDIVAVLPCDDKGEPKFDSIVFNVYYMSYDDYVTEYGDRAGEGSDSR